MDLTLLPVVFFILSCLLSDVSSAPSRNITSMFTLGDSHIDTGNALIMAAPVIPVWIDKPPYGETFFGHPSGRFSDGRVITDFIAETLGLPFLPAYLASSPNDVSQQGVNLAVGGATAIEVAFFETNGLVPFKLLNNSLDVQLGWFEQIKPSVCDNGALDCLGKALFFVGELGVNDYNFIWMAGKTDDQVKTYVPKVVDTISMAVERLINEGAVYIVVPGNPPTGCSPAILTFRLSPNKTEYDHIGCLRDVNAVARYHNLLLRAAVGSLRGRYPHARIVFADFYDPIIRILENPGQFGFAGDALKACCGTGGAYNWDPSAFCGMPGVAACENPAAYVSWDGVHYTEATNRYVAEGWLRGPYADPPILSALQPRPH
ncbi:hypothetical protein SETIT_3G186200v2 [Setaria italica]|uniref:Uncharacterized protein n=1 Tax=Setaria italica TaxID=4555 RepID=K3ZFB4_SETIT|nr:GDSL esterase/lipase At2g27360 [Setaria italica]RCV17031.1 hypothetical protein SETIT_3G186200v2 [Setaria italica]